MGGERDVGHLAVSDLPVLVSGGERSGVDQVRPERPLQDLPPQGTGRQDAAVRRMRQRLPHVLPQTRGQGEGQGQG